MCIDPKIEYDSWTGIGLANTYKTLTWMTVQTPTRSLLAALRPFHRIRFIRLLEQHLTKANRSFTLIDRSLAYALAGVLRRLGHFGSSTGFPASLA